MSEFQYYEFQTVDQPLTQQETEELHKLSSRARITKNRATFVYHFGDFRGNSDEVLAKYFDAFLYTSNFGTKQLGFRLPTRLFKAQLLSLYEYEYIVEIAPYPDQTIVMLHLNDEEGGGWLEEDDCASLLDDMLSLRQDLLLGDSRALYLALLANQGHREIESYVQSLPVPPGLKTLTPALQSFAEFFEINSEVLQQAAAQSADMSPLSLDPTHLSEEEKNTYLQRVLHNDPLVRFELQDVLTQKMAK